MRARLDQVVVDAQDPKKLVHLDIEVGDISSGAALAESYGAQRVGALVTTELGSYQVMCDPEGNEFCFVAD